VEETHLRYGLWSNVVVTLILRTRLKTTTTSHATRVSVTLLHVVLVHSRSWSKIVCAIELNPRVHAFQVIEHLRTIDDEIANVRKLRHRFELDRLVEIVDECRA